MKYAESQKFFSDVINLFSYQEFLFIFLAMMKEKNIIFISENPTLICGMITLL